MGESRAQIPGSICEQCIMPGERQHGGFCAGGPADLAGELEGRSFLVAFVKYCHPLAVHEQQEAGLEVRGQGQSRIDSTQGLPVGNWHRCDSSPALGFMRWKSTRKGTGKGVKMQCVLQIIIIAIKASNCSYTKCYSCVMSFNNLPPALNNAVTQLSESSSCAHSVFANLPDC